MDTEAGNRTNVMEFRLLTKKHMDDIISLC